VGDDKGSWRKGAPSGPQLADLHRQGVLAWKPVPNGEISAGGGLAGRTGTNPIGLGSRRDGLAYIPESAAPDNPRPLLVMFHGAGASARDVMPMIAEIAERRSVMVLAPDSRGNTWDVIEHEYGPDVAFLDRALNQALETGAVDARHVAFAGFSDGGSYALSLGLINGELVSDALGFSPGYIAPTRKEDAPRFFISHGREDPVLPIERCGRRIAGELRRAGYDVDYREFSGGHVAPPDMIATAFRRFLG
jgi:phospholipase/carboxylesterase